MLILSFLWEVEFPVDPLRSINLNKLFRINKQTV